MGLFVFGSLYIDRLPTLIRYVIPKAQKVGLPEYKRLIRRIIMTGGAAALVVTKAAFSTSTFIIVLAFVGIVVGKRRILHVLLFAAYIAIFSFIAFRKGVRVKIQ